MAIIQAGGLFLILAWGETEALGQAIEQEYPGNYYVLAPGQWLVSASGTTTREVSDGLGISDGTTGNAIIVSIANYYGRASEQIWEWMASRGT